MLSNEEILIKDRVAHLLRVMKVNITDLADSESERVNMGRQINGAGAVSTKTLIKILYALQSIDANWLLMGEGSMYKDEHVGSRIYTTTNNNNVAENAHQYGPVNIGRDSVQVIRNREIDAREQKIAELTKRVEELEHDKAFLQTLLSSFQKSTKK